MRDTGIEDEIDEIRLRIYERTKDMTVEERREHRRKNIEWIVKEYGLTIVPSADKKIDTP